MPSAATGAPSPKNIFNPPLAGAKAAIKKPTEDLRKKNQKKASAYLVVAAVLLIAYSFYFLYPQAKAYLESPAKLQSMKQDIEDADSLLLNLKQERDSRKAAYEIELSGEDSKINIILPPTFDKVGIVRLLENFATKIDAQSPHFEFNSITFGEPEKKDGYTILPISTSIRSSRQNFDRFLKLINLSGRIDGEIPIRLMEISSINIRYRGIDRRTGEDQGVDFSVKINAYSR